MRPGYRHDVCSTVQPMAAAAPFFREFDLAQPRRPAGAARRSASPTRWTAAGRRCPGRSLEETAAGPGRRRGGLPPAVRPAGRARPRRHRLLPDQPPAPAAHPQRRRRSPASGSTGCPTCAGWPHRYFDTDAGAGARRRGRRARDARPHPAADRRRSGCCSACCPPRGLAADRGRLAEAGRRDGHRARGAGRRGGHRPRGHRPARVRRRPGRPARHHARGVRGDGRRPA